MGLQGKIAYIICLIFSVFIGALTPLVFGTDSQQTASKWLSAELKLDEVGPYESNPNAVSTNRDCYVRTVLTRPSRIIPVWPFWQDELGSTGCAVDTAYGGVNQRMLQRQGTDIFGPVYFDITTMYPGQEVNIFPIPGSTTLAYFQPEYVSKGRYIAFLKDASTHLWSKADHRGEVRHTLMQDGVTLRDKSGARIPVYYDSISFSANGKWMVADSPGLATIRVDLETFDILPFGHSFNHNLGVSVNQQTAITNDGRYAVSSSRDFSHFKLYDLETCAAVPQKITKEVSCQSRDILTHLLNKVEGFISASHLRFIGNDSLKLNIASQPMGSARKVRQYVLYTGEQSFGKLQYLALGDSFASGEGAHQYKSLTDTPDNKCHLSLRSYPYLIANLLNYNQYESVACSGAKMEDVYSSTENYLGQQGVKIAQDKRENLRSILEGRLPGYITQHTFVKEIKPQIITLSVVGNSIGFSNIIKRCVGLDTCYSIYEERKELLQHINDQFDGLTKLYEEVKSATDPRTKIYVMGYPEIVKSGGNCGNNVHLNGGETYFANKLTAFLNDMIKRAADKAGVVYIDVSQALHGYRLCETDKNNIGVNGLTAGDDTVKLLKGPLGKESYHPNHIGHELLAKAIMEVTDNFTKPSHAQRPVPNRDIQAEKITDDLKILQVPRKDRQIRKIHQLPVGMPIVRGQSVDVTAPEYILSPNTGVEAVLYSDPQFLGNLQTDASGNLTVKVAIPADVPAGYHTIHLFGTDIIGTPVDIQQQIFVMASEQDIDGDGILNEDDPCPIVTPSNQDIDQDGKDDACDGFIDEPPVTEPEPETPEESEPTNPQPVEVPGVIIEPNPPIIQGPGADKNFLTESNPLGSYVGAAQPPTTSPAQSTNSRTIAVADHDTPSPIETASVLAEQSATLAETVPVNKPPQPEAHSHETGSNLLIRIVGTSLVLAPLLTIFYLIRQRKN